MRFKLGLFCLLTVGILALFQTGCAAPEKFVALSADVLPKSVSIQVTGIADRLVLKIEGNKFVIEQTTVTVRVSGAGVFISPNNHVLTCSHLFSLREVTAVTVCNADDVCTAAEILAREDQLDLALVQSNFDRPTPYARIGDPRDLRVGQEVLAVGTPLGFGFSVSHGIISALHRDDLGVYNMTQSDAFINPGNSGGPLFNLEGEIVGINSRMVPPVAGPVFTGLGFSVQSGQIVEFLTRVKDKYRALPRFSLDYWKNFLGGW